MEEFRRLLRSSAPDSWLFERTRTGGIGCSPAHSIKRARAATFALGDVVLYPGVARLAVARLRLLGFGEAAFAHFATIELACLVEDREASEGWWALA
jgi:hypothetical protein